MPTSKASARASSDVEVVAGGLSRQHLLAQNAPAVTMHMPIAMLNDILSTDTPAAISKTFMLFRVFYVTKPHISKCRNKVAVSTAFVRMSAGFFSVFSFRT